LKASAAAIDAATVALDLSKKQYQSGYANYLALLSAEQAYQQALINLVQAQSNLSLRVVLYLGKINKFQTLSAKSPTPDGP